MQRYMKVLISNIELNLHDGIDFTDFIDSSLFHQSNRSSLKPNRPQGNSLGKTSTNDSIIWNCYCIRYQHLASFQGTLYFEFGIDSGAAKYNSTTVLLLHKKHPSLVNKS